MDKQFYSPLQLLNIATTHAYCAEYLLQDNAEIMVSGYGTNDALSAVTSLMYTAFELTFKAYLLHRDKKNNQHKNLMELLEVDMEIGLSHQDRQLLKTLSRHQAFRKGVDYGLWDDRQQLQIFCSDLIALYERLQELMPLELQKDYLNT